MSQQVGLRIGLTGGIGSGKSTVSRLLAHLGARVVDTDALARELTLPGGAALPMIVQRFGPEMIDGHGALDRTRMRELVFNQAQAKRELEAILHPLIQARSTELAAQARPGQTIVFDVPLLAESGDRWRRQVDRVLVIDCDESTQVARVMARNGWTEQQVRQIMAQQANRQARLAVADDVIVNDGVDLKQLQQATESLWHKWQQPHAGNIASL